MIQVVVNGQAHPVNEGTTLSALLDTLGLQRDRVAVERNREIVHREAWDQLALQPEDRLEIVQFVGGG